MKPEYANMTPAQLVGKRIKTIRISKGLSQTELGESVGLNADRIQKYENGIRKPKEDMVIKIANALGVNPLAIDNPYILNDEDMMHMLFMLEDMFDYTEFFEEQGTYYIGLFPHDSNIRKYLDAWFKKIEKLKREKDILNLSTEEKENLAQSYEAWKWNFPDSLNEEEYSSIDQKIAETKADIQKLQEKLEILNNKRQQINYNL